MPLTQNAVDPRSLSAIAAARHNEMNERRVVVATTTRTRAFRDDDDWDNAVGHKRLPCYAGEVS
jgi:hypothetical protein